VDFIFFAHNGLGLKISVEGITRAAMKKSGGEKKKRRNQKFRLRRPSDTMRHEFTFIFGKLPVVR
jgi:hypothetical protein